MKIFLNCEDNQTLKSWTKKIYLLEADKRLGLNIFYDIGTFDSNKDSLDYVLHIQPCKDTDARGIKWTGLWHIDCGDESYLSNRYDSFDTVFLASSSSLRKGDNTQLLFQAADSMVHRRLPDINQDYDFTFCGGIDSLPRHEERKRVYDIMKKHFSYYDWGKGYPPHEFIRNYNVGKVQFIQSAFSPKGEGMCAQRFFECLAIGPVLCNWCPDLEYTGLRENEDYLTFRNDIEMMAKMEMLLSDRDFRDTIAANGRKKSLMYHSYEQRAVAIINTVRRFCE